VPSAIFYDLATWHLINFQYTQQVMSRVEALRADYSDVQLHERLVTVLRRRLGHRLANDVEQAKIFCSSTAQAAVIGLQEIERGLASRLSPAQMTESLNGMLAQVAACARECVRRAMAPEQNIDAIYLTGGSSALRSLQERLAAQFPGVPLVQGDLFGGVAAGLAYAAQQRFG
jgi:hypothetical chaperone protein